ncbi:MAG: GDSL-type esterase/lipase family protein [Geminicoccaceae bacterium]
MNFSKPTSPSWLVILVALLLQGCSNKPPLHHDDFLYSAVGASDILGVGAFPLSNGYTFRIQGELQDQGRNIALFQIGLPGANTDIIADAVEKAADKGLETEFATVWVGANDLVNGVPVETFASELSRLLGLLQDEIDAYVVIANLPNLQSFPNFIEEPVPEVTDQRVLQYNATINALAIERGIPVVNLVDDAIGKHLVYDFDGLHPDDEGHDRLAKLFMNVIRPVL